MRSHEKPGRKVFNAKPGAGGREREIGSKVGGPWGAGSPEHLPSHRRAGRYLVFPWTREPDRGPMAVPEEEGERGGGERGQLPELWPV